MLIDPVASPVVQSWESSPDWADVAVTAGDESAKVITADSGAREYRRLGAMVGFATAVDDAELGEWDFHQGYAHASDNDRARQDGAYAGAAKAEAMATADARDAVRDVFRNLHHEPQADPLPPHIPFFESNAEQMPEPNLESLISELTASWRNVDLQSVDPALHDLYRDPTQALRYTSTSSLAPPAFTDPQLVFSLWLQKSPRSDAYYAIADPEDQATFFSIFEQAFLERLAWSFDTALKPAYDQGFETGWELGTDICYEHFFQKGYAKAYNIVFKHAVATSFETSYTAIYTRQYLVAFSDWSNNAHPEILYLSLRDHTEDDIFEPGELVIADFGIVNFGGAEGETHLRLTGSELKAQAPTTVSFPARSRFVSNQPLTSVIRADAEPSALSLVELRVGESRKSAELFVDYPLRFLGAASLESLDLQSGRAVIEATVRNQSSQEHHGTVELRSAPGGRTRSPVMIGPIKPHQTATITFQVEDLDPARLRSDGIDILIALSQEGQTVDALAARLTAGSDNGSGSGSGS